MILIGELALWVALLMAAWSAITSFAGGKAGRADLMLSGERGIYATCVLTAAAAAGLWTALLTHDFSLRYVASHTSANLPAVYSFAAFWAGQSGSLLLWALLLALCSAMTLLAKRKSNRELMPFVTGTLATVLLVFLAAVCLAANPYERLDWIPSEGVGMNPQLQNPGMVLHQPSLYLGYVATAIPFAFGVAALVTRRLNEQWVAEVRRWSLVSWCFLSAGILIGMWWTYIEPRTTGSWGWDAASNRSLLPWITTTAFLCSIAIAEKRGMFSRWSVDVAAVRGARPIQKYGRYVVYAGATFLLVGIAAAAFRKGHDARLRPGESFTTRDPYGSVWTFTAQGVSRFQSLNRNVTAVAVQATRGSERVGLISSEKRQYLDSRGVATFEPSTEAGMHSGPLQDTYITLENLSDDEVAELRISFNPLMIWAWIGGAALILGVTMVMWPPSRRMIEDVKNTMGEAG